MITLFALAVFLLQLYTIVDTLGGDYSVLAKIVWIFIVICLPIIGSLLYFLTKK